jgi:hypothetical protein
MRLRNSPSRKWQWERPVRVATKPRQIDRGTTGGGIARTLAGSMSAARSSAMKYTAIAVIALFSVVCSHRVIPTMEIGTNLNGEITVRVVNETPIDLVLVSPSVPMRTEDAEECALVLSTQVSESVQTYDFTPQLVSLNRGQAHEATLVGPDQTVERCRDWAITVEYAFMTADEARRYRNRTGEELRQFLLRHQQVLHSRVTLHFAARPAS